MTKNFDSLWNGKMGISPLQYADMLARLEGNKIRQGNRSAPQAERELPLHDEILSFCARQWPRWKVIRARPDQRSTIPVGCQDMTIFAPKGRVLCIELKRRDGKVSKEQAAWHAEMRMLGHEVHVVRSMAEFRALLAENTPETAPRGVLMAKA